MQGQGLQIKRAEADLADAEGLPATWLLKLLQEGWEMFAGKINVIIGRKRCSP